MSSCRTVQGGLIEAWFEAVELLIEQPSHHIDNLVVRIDYSVPVAQHMLGQIDRQLNNTGNDSVKSVARTIFPESVGSGSDWQRSSTRIVPRLKINESYYRRIVEFPSGPTTTNQLLAMINSLNRRTTKGARRVDPGPIVLERPDRTVAEHIGFPCLSLIQFHRDVDVLLMSAVYRSHHYHKKALGNFVGLKRLHVFVAQETGLTAGELTILSTAATLENINACKALITKFKAGEIS